MNERSLRRIISDNTKRISRSSISISTTILITVAIFYGVLFRFFPDQINISENSQTIAGILVFLAAVILAFLNLIAYVFFTQYSYLIISLGWFINAAYLLSEFFFADPCKQDSHSDNCLTFSVKIFLLSMASTVVFSYAAEFKGDREQPKGNFISIPWFVWAIFTGILLITVYYLINQNFHAGKFFLYTLPGSLYTAYAFVHLTAVFIKSPEVKEYGNSSRLIKLFPLTFLLYGLIQFTYPFKIYFKNYNYELFLQAMFTVALILKSLNVLGLVKLIVRKYSSNITTLQELELAQANETLALTSLKLTEEALTLAQSRLVRRKDLAALGAIAASIEHDLKTPLASLQSDIMNLSQLNSSNPRMKTYINRLQTHKNRIAAIARIIPFIRASKDFYNREKFMDKVSLNSLVNLAVKAVKNELNLDTQKFFFRIDIKGSEYYIHAFPQMIEQIIVNLFKNSVDAIREGGNDGGVINIKIRQEKELPESFYQPGRKAKDYDKWVRLNIRDEGCGIAKENIPRLTTLYTSKNDDKPNGGIGLFIAKKLLNIHDSLIFFESDVGKGTTVSLFFPENDAYLKRAGQEIKEEDESDYDLDDPENIKVYEQSEKTELTEVTSYVISDDPTLK